MSPDVPYQDFIHLDYYETTNMNLTNAVVQKTTLPAGKVQHFLRDEKLPGFGVRISKTAKTFYVERKVNGQTVRTSIGKFPEITTQEARNKAMELASVMADGLNPNDEKRKKTLKSRTLEDYLTEYFEHKKLAKNTILDMNGTIRRHLTDWLNMPLSSITPIMVKDRHKKISEKTKFKANRCFDYLSAIINYAIDDAELREIYDLFPKGNPVRILSKLKLKNSEPPRQVIVPVKSMGIFFNTIFKMINEGRIGANVLLFALLTGIRKSEATEGLRWENVDLKDRTFYISHTKNGTPHKLPLTNYTFEMLNNISIKNGNPSSGIVFLPTRGEKVSNLRYVEAEIEKALELRVTIHDLRRTFSTLAARVLTHYEHKKLMNHYDNRDVTMTHYVVFDVEDLRIPLQKLEDYILSLK